MNKTILLGRICNELELKQAGEKVVCNFSIAINGYNDRTDFIPIAVFGKQAENLTKFCGKGSQVLVDGSIQVNSVDDGMGNKKTYTKVLANNITYVGNKNDVKENKTSSIDDDFGSDVVIDDGFLD